MGGTSESGRNVHPPRQGEEPHETSHAYSGPLPGASFLQPLSYPNIDPSSLGTGLIHDAQNLPINQASSIEQASSTWGSEGLTRYGVPICTDQSPGGDHRIPPGARHLGQFKIARKQIFPL